MVKKDLKNSKNLDLLHCLLENPTQSINKIAEKINMYRRTVLRKKKELEDSHVIWGYTAVIDERKLDRALYIAIFKLRPISSKKLPDLVTRRLTTGASSELGVRLVDVLYTTGMYACILKFSAPDHTTATRYFETLRAVYKDYFLEEPLLFEVDFPLVRQGKLNPELEKVYDFVPKIGD